MQPCVQTHVRSRWWGRRMQPPTAATVVASNTAASITAEESKVVAAAAGAAGQRKVHLHVVVRLGGHIRRHEQSQCARALGAKQQ